MREERKKDNESKIKYRWKNRKAKESDGEEICERVGQKGGQVEATEGQMIHGKKKERQEDVISGRWKCRCKQ